jgi:hypothetical protein
MTELRDRLQATLGEAYRITGELGGGGMSRMFVAEEPELGRSVVVKVLRDGSPGSIVVRFDRSDRQPLRPEFSSDGRHFYFALDRHEADIWVVELQPRE